MRVALMAVAATLLHSASVFANTLYVGPASCGPKVTHYATIQAAVNAAAPADTVMVCPGTYAEQVVIPIPLTVRGFVNGVSGAAVITVPPTGLVPNITMTTAGLVAAQIAAQNTFGVKLIDLTIDGTNEGCATSVGANYTAAIALSNLVSSDPSFLSVSLSQLSIQNQRGGCQLSAGVLSEDSLISVDSNSIYNVELNAVSLVRGMGKITNNTIENCTTGGVFVSNVTGATVQSNTMSSDAFGVRIDSSTATNVWSNTMGPWVGEGVYSTASSGTWVNGNRISATWAGVYLDGSQGDRVTSNTIVRTETYGIADTNSRGGNQLSGNTINGAPIGLFFDASASAAGDVVTTNTYLNVVTTTSSTPIL
ncbi:MAG TPA: NosD domain-containing protein [Vicinamibacterales bacterium]|nr:NosD domain-containing protein [Vicinamibacterales bacterium]